MTHVVLAPSAEVTDVAEWYARLDRAVALATDQRWRCEHDCVVANIPDDEAISVIERARGELGESLEVREGDAVAVFVADLVSGRPIDE